MLYVALMVYDSRKKAGADEERSRKWFLPTAALVGFLSGLVGTAGPIGAAAFLSCNLSPAAYIASDAMSSLIMHGAKLTLYSTNLQISQSSWVIALVLSVATVLGSLCGKVITEKLSTRTFRKVALSALTIAGFTLLI